MTDYRTRSTFADAMRAADRHAKRHTIPDTARGVTLAVLGVLALVLALLLIGGTS